MSDLSIITERNQGAGHRYQFRAYYDPVRKGDREMSAREYVERWGWDALVEHGHAAEGNLAEEAVEKLRNQTNP